MDLFDTPTDNLSENRQLAVIGTAGRDKAHPMTADLWQHMLQDIRSKVRPDDTLISGGAAWADHLAVAMFLEGRVKELVLHLPAPLERGKFQGPSQSAASAANFYHQKFSATVGVDTIAEIQTAIDRGARVTAQPVASGYSAMFARNAIVAKESDSVVAYTFGEGKSPKDGGTKNTWDQIQGEKIHVLLDTIHLQTQASVCKTMRP